MMNDEFFNALINSIRKNGKKKTKQRVFFFFVLSKKIKKCAISLHRKILLRNLAPQFNSFLKSSPKELFLYRRVERQAQ